MNISLSDQNILQNEDNINFQGLLNHFKKITLCFEREEDMCKTFEKVYKAENKDVYYRFLLFDGRTHMEIPLATTYALLESVEKINVQKWPVIAKNIIHFIAYYNETKFHSLLHEKLQEDKFKDDRWKMTRNLCSNDAAVFFEGVISLLDLLQNKKMKLMKNLNEDIPASRIFYQFETINDKMLLSFINEKRNLFFHLWSDEERRLYRKKMSRMLFFSKISLLGYEKMVDFGNIVPKGTNLQGYNKDAIVKDEFDQILNFLVKSAKNTSYSGKRKKKFIHLFDVSLCLLAFSFDFDCADAIKEAQKCLKKCIEIQNTVDTKIINQCSKELFCVLKKGNMFRISVCDYFIENLMAHMRRFWKISSNDNVLSRDGLNFLQVEVKNDIIANGVKTTNLTKSVQLPYRLPLKKRKIN